MQNYKLEKAKQVKIIPTIINPEKQIRRGATIHINCPFHLDSSPSLAYYVNTNTWYCFADGTGGDAVAFYQKLHEVDFKTALEELTRL